MRYIIYLINLLFLILLLNSCGSSDTVEGDDAKLIGIEKIIVLNCNLTNSDTALNDCNGYTCIKNSDTLVSNTNSTLLEIIHLSNNDKKVCVKQGMAHILR